MGALVAEVVPTLAKWKDAMRLTKLICYPMQGALLGLFVSLAGCGQGASGLNIAPVTGQVTLNGQPLPGAMVEFIPEQGRPSVAITNQEGAYELNFTSTEKGAIVGMPYRVKIKTGREAVTAEGEQISPPVPEKLPKKYHDDSELTATIEPGKNVIDFPLTSH